jgi:hypothetical protein
MWRYSVVLLIAIVAHTAAFSQNVVFTAAAGANKIGLRDQVQVQYTIRDAQNLQTISSPATNDFAIVGGPYQSQSSNTSITGNKVVTSQSVSLTYVLQPRHEGTFTIPPVMAKDAGGHSYASNALTIQVVQGSVLAQQQQQQRRQRGYDPFGDDDDVMAMMQRMQQMQQQQMQAMQQHMQQVPQGRQQQMQQQQQQKAPEVSQEEIKKDLFIRVVADKTKVKLGEQVTINYKLYSRIPMQMNISKLPSLNGFWTQDFDIPRDAKPTEEMLDGKKYQVFLLKKSALFPQQTGTLELDPAEAKGVARIVQQVKRKMSDMFGGTLLMSDPYFNNSFYNTTAYRDVEVHLKSTPVRITVAPLPENGKPADFSGGVGKFTVASSIDKQDITTDDVATLKLTISGSGNLKLIEAPKLGLPNGLSNYDPQVIDTITSRSTTISGSKIINYVIAAQTPGDYDIKPIPFTYFNAQAGQYVTEYTQAFKLHVKPGKQYNPSRTAGTNMPLRDIHDISKQALGKVVPQGRPLLFTAGYWSMYALPLLGFIGLIVYKRREDEQQKDSVLLRKKRANRIALQRLALAKKYLQQQSKKPFYEEISKAIWLYLSDKLSIPLSALSRETATEAMNKRKVPASVQQKLEKVIWECETSLYASGGTAQMAHVYDEAVQVITELEDAFKA